MSLSEQFYVEYQKSCQPELVEAGMRFTLQPQLAFDKLSLTVLYLLG
jgi:hypothetical protein